MRNKYLLTLLIAVLIFSFKSEATHVVGGVIEYVRLGPGALPNSSRYKIKLKLWRDAGGNPWFPASGGEGRPTIEVRGDTLGYTALGFDPYTTFGTNSLSGIERMRDPLQPDQPGRFNKQFVRDFQIGCGIPLDTLTVRSVAMTATIQNNNTRLPRTTGVPTYENPGYNRFSANYPTSQYMKDGDYGFIKGVCGLCANTNKTDFINGDACTGGRICSYQYVNTCAFQPNIAVQYGEYIRVVDLPNIPGGWHLTYKLCCRNTVVKNINTNPYGDGEQGYSVYARIPDIAQRCRPRRRRRRSLFPPHGRSG